MRPPRIKRHAAAVAAAATALAAIAACSDSTPGNAGGASGGAYKVMILGPVTGGPGVQAPPQPELRTGAEAAAKAVNDAGGVDGHKIQLLTCDTQGTKNGGVTCATRAAREKVLAVVGAVDFYGDYISVLKSVGIPNVGPLPIQDELSDTNSYPVEGGATVVPAAVVSYAARNGATSLAYVGNTSAYTSSIPKIMAPVVRRHPGFSAHLISIPATAVDVAPYVAQALKDKYVDVATFSPTATLAFVKGYLAAGGSPGSVLAASSTLTAALIKSLGAAAEGLKITSLFVPAGDPSPAAVAFTKDMNAVDPGAAKSESSENAYLAVKLFAAAVKGRSARSAADVKAGIAKIENLDLGLVPPISFDHPVPGAPAPRVFNDAVMLAEVKNGAVVAAGGFFSAYTGQDVSK
jgi:ABC-type branched-subunit amino acid transport system substrate-binding protein